MEGLETKVSHMLGKACLRDPSVFPGDNTPCIRHSLLLGEVSIVHHSSKGGQRKTRSSQLALPWIPPCEPLPVADFSLYPLSVINCNRKYNNHRESLYQTIETGDRLGAPWTCSWCRSEGGLNDPQALHIWCISSSPFSLSSTFLGLSPTFLFRTSISLGLGFFCFVLQPYLWFFIIFMRKKVL